MRSRIKIIFVCNMPPFKNRSDFKEKLGGRSFRAVLIIINKSKFCVINWVKEFK